jgi:hypothetical protein
MLYSVTIATLCSDSQIMQHRITFSVFFRRNIRGRDLALFKVREEVEER